MKIVWLTNISLPEANMLMKEKSTPFGGWLINASKDLANQENIDLSIMFPSNKATEFKELRGEKINYYPFIPIKETDKKRIEYNELFETLLNNLKPDIVHIYGTELPHTLSMVNTCEKLGIETIISIQGLVSVYAKHIYANLPPNIIYGFTLRNLLRKDSVYLHKKTFESRGENEIQSLKKTKHIIGRTTWDKACSNQINSKAKYHFCNETLREEFYKRQWDIQECEKHSIFLSQGQYPIKGLHYMLKAMPLILKKFPNAKVYIGGKDITKSDSLKDRLLLTYYGKYIQKMIKKMKLEKNVAFTGPLDEEKMCQRYLKSHVFVCPSSIENSPNSIGEAMLLGVPCVASHVGGILELLRHEDEGFIYQPDAPYMLAHYVCEIFENEDFALEFSRNAREHALITHDRIENTRRLIEIYNSILVNDDCKIMQYK